MRFFSLALIIAGALFLRPAFGEELGPKATVEAIFAKSANTEISTDITKQKEVNTYVDFAVLATSALGKDGTKLSKQDLEWFKETLQEIITRTVYPKAPDFLKGVKISYSGIEELGNFVTIKSEVQNKADITEVNYKLQKSADSKWRVVDVSISGISWVESINDQVHDVLKKKKWKGLKDALSKRLQELKNGKP